MQFQRPRLAATQSVSLGLNNGALCLSVRPRGARSDTMSCVTQLHGTMYRGVAFHGGESVSGAGLGCT